MVIRVLPASKGGIYSNAGSSHFLVNYLEHEAREEKQQERVPVGNLTPGRAIFFDQQREGIRAEEVQERIDGNVQGVQKGKPLFHSLVISPSQDELRHLSDDPDKLKAYTRQVMENYAANFTQKRKESLTSDNLVWYATIHRSRHYSGLDDAVQTGQAQSRQRKEGEQTHIHVIVSARDRTMSRSLHPDAGSSRFNYKAWLQKNRKDFEQTFGYKITLTEKQHQERLEKQIARLDRLGLSLDRERMMTVGRHHAYSTDFWKGMSQVERGVKQGSIFTANQAYDRLDAATEPKPKNARHQPDDSRAIQSYEPGIKTQSERATNHQPLTTKLVAPVEEKSKRDNTASPEPRQVTGKEAKPELTKSTNKQEDKPSRTDLSPLISALRFESVPETGAQARSQDDDYRRRIKRRR